MSRLCVQATWDDAPHLTDEQKSSLWDAIPAHQRDARTKGEPQLGQGVVFPVSDESIACDPVEIPRHWARIGGLDFGWDHPFAAVCLAHDRDTDVVYVTQAYRESQATPVIHAAALRPWGSWIPWAWPHDGLQHDKGSGDALAGQYREQQLNMLADRATFEDGGSGVEAGVLAMLDRMKTGRLKVYRHLEEWFAEKRLYHRKDGKIVKLRDDLISATRYALMMIRFAEVEPMKRRMEAVGPIGGWM